MRQQLELISSMQIENEKRFAENEKRFAENEKRFTQITQQFAVCLDSIKRLERIALAHEIRMEDIDARLDELERRRG